MSSISAFSSSDLLSPMRSSMNSIAAVGAPTNAAGASHVLANGAGYLQGAHETIAKIDQSIERRTKALTELQQSDPAAAQADFEQLDLLNRLRTRIEQSIQRVGEILSGDTPEGQASSAKLQQQADDLDQLEARRRLLAGSLTFDAPVAATLVANTYAAGRA